MPRNKTETEINNIETNITMKRFNEIKSCCFVQINKIDKYLSKQKVDRDYQKQRRWGITTETKEI